MAVTIREALVLWCTCSSLLEFVPFSHTLSSQAASPPYLLPLPFPALSLPFTLGVPLSSLQLNLFSFHPSSASTAQWETNRHTFGRLPLSLSLELIAVLQSVWFDFIGAIGFSKISFRVWLQLRHEPNWGFYYRHVSVTVTELETKIWQVVISWYFFL